MLDLVAFPVLIFAVIAALTVAITSWNPAKLAIAFLGLVVLSVFARLTLGDDWQCNTVPVLQFGALVALIRIIAIALQSREMDMQSETTEPASR